MSKAPKLTPAKVHQVVSWDIDKVVPYAKNAKLHSPEQVAKLAKSIQELGWDQPIVVDKDGVIIKGHGRFLAAKHLSMSKVPVIVRDDLTPAQVQASRLADNRLASLDYDTNLLNAELGELAKISVDLGDLGFSERELSFLTNDLGKVADGSFVEDVAGASQDQANANAATVTALDSSSVSLSQAFGFKTVPSGSARMLGEFVSAIEVQTGKKGSEALVDFVKEILAANRAA